MALTPLLRQETYEVLRHWKAQNVLFSYENTIVVLTTAFSALYWVQHMRRAGLHEIPLNPASHSITIIVYTTRHRTSSLPGSRGYVVINSGKLPNFLTCLKLSSQYSALQLSARGHSFLNNLSTTTFRTFHHWRCTLKNAFGIIGNVV